MLVSVAMVTVPLGMVRGQNVGGSHRLQEGVATYASLCCYGHWFLWGWLGVKMLADHTGYKRV